MRKMTTPSGGGQKKFSSAPVITRPVVPPPGGSTSVHPTSSSNTRTTTYNTSTTNAGATSRSGSSMSTGLKVMIGVILAVIAFVFINVMSHIDRDTSDTISIINGDFTIFVGQTAEVRIRSSASRLTANFDSCIDAEWNKGKSSGGTYYLNVTGTSVGTCTLTIRKKDNEKIYDTITIRVIPAESGGVAAGDSNGIVDANGDDVVVVQPIDRKHDTKGTAMSITVNTSTTDSIDSSSDEAWYVFSLNAPGYISITFEHESANTTNYLWDLYLYRDDGSTFYDEGSRYWSVDGEKGLTTCNVGLPAGTYYFRVDAYSSSNWSRKNYSYVINYEISDSWEKEINNANQVLKKG